MKMCNENAIIEKFKHIQLKYLITTHLDAKESY